MRNRKSLAMFLVTAVTTGSFALAQEQKPSAPDNNVAERAADRVDKASDRVADKLDRTGEAARTAGDKLAADAKPLALPAGVTAKDLDEQDDIRDAFEAITEGAISNDAFDNVVNRLVDADRDRISKFKDSKPDMKPLTDRVAAIKQMWKDKYGKEFDLDEDVVFGAKGFVAIAQGEISDPAQLAGNWPVPVQAGSAAMPAAVKKPGINTVDQAAETGKLAGGDTNINKGRNVAVARYPASHGLPSLDTSLTHEMPDIWRFDVPDTLDGQKLMTNLVTQLNALGDSRSWPDDVNEAYRAVGHRVLLAIYDVKPRDAGERAQ